MNIPRPIDDQLVTILHEITDDPAGLLSTFTTRLRTSTRPFSAPTSLDEDNFFTQSERSLLRRHREELGHLLFQRCFEFVKEEPVGVTQMLFGANEDCQSDEILLEDCAKSAFSLGQVSRKIFDLALQPIAESNVAQCSALACELAPCFYSIVLHALVMNRMEKHKEALVFLNEVDVVFAEAKKKRIVEQNRNLVLCSLGELDGALVCARAAYDFPTPRVVDAFNLLSLELVAGDGRGILHASHVVEDVATSECSEVQSLVGAVGADRARFASSIRKGQAALARNLEGKLHATAKALIDEIYN